jgi:hypothetical protein
MPGWGWWTPLLKRSTYPVARFTTLFSGLQYSNSFRIEAFDDKPDTQ